MILDRQMLTVGFSPICIYIYALIGPALEMTHAKIREYELPIIRRIEAAAHDQNVIRFDVLVPSKTVSKHFLCPKTFS
jgi:hypothetical protein